MKRRTAWPIVLLLLLVGSLLVAQPAAAADTTPPSAPSWVSVKDVTNTSIRVYWGGATDASGIQTYKVYRDGVHVQDVAGNVTHAWTDTGLTPGTVYYYEVRAVDPSGNVGPANDELAATLGTPAETPPPDPNGPIRGYMTHIPHLTGAAIDDVADLAADSGANTIRDEAWWGRIEATEGVFDWTLPDSVVRAAAERGLRVLLMADTAPTWASGATEGDPGWFSTPPIDPADYGNFAGELAERYGTGGAFWAANPDLTFTPLAGIEIWNEQNGEAFWGGNTVDPAHYTAMLQSAYTAIKAADPSITVVVGGLASGAGSAYNDADCDGTADGGYLTGHGLNPVDYLEEMYAAGAQGYFDAVGWHPYVFDFDGEKTMPQLLDYDPCSTWSQLAETPVSARSLMVANGDSAKKVWITEAGIPTCVLFAVYPCVYQSDQALLLHSEFAKWKTYTWGGGFIVYDMHDDCTSPLNVQCNFGVATTSNTPKLAYDFLRVDWLGE
ncbi:fibronectin type III domain-containing protein [Jiangella anatolica]|uniref:Fibronectin type-III domain-containing protein n=1 Tax=Jiangella anatolica TaxID=2670374 RepID=A0A2W2BJT3_9ACTN|nr:fibronectin type III domain-containing protein [Jiangella anatolica]PZF86262.1 hypothetical protein C1I92_01865 [Jiangella anatolica]